MAWDCFAVPGTGCFESVQDTGCLESLQDTGCLESVQDTGCLESVQDTVTPHHDQGLLERTAQCQKALSQLQVMAPPTG